jgi:ribonuclease VapC
VIVDSSALLALVLEEPDGTRVAHELSVNQCVMSAPNYFEASIVMLRRQGTEAARAMKTLMENSGIRIVPFDESLAVIALEAYKKYGRGSGHKASLNFGDCFSYALAKQRDEPLLAVGSEFEGVGVARA